MDRFFLILSASLLSSALSQFHSPNLGGAIGCVVTKNRLYSGGNYIRDLTASEADELSKYRSGMESFKKRISEAFLRAEEIEVANSTVPPMPIRPSMPDFCRGSDTTQFIFPGCSVQNYKVYIGKTFARDLDKRERSKLDKFIARSHENQQAMANNPSAVTASPVELQKDLQFCTEF